MMKSEQPTLNELCLGKTYLPSIREGRSLMRTPKNKVPNSSDSSGRVLVVSEDRKIRDFLGQMLRLHGYECEYLEKMPKVIVEPYWTGFDALFIESRFLEQFHHGTEHGVASAPNPPLVVVLGDYPSAKETGTFRVLKKPLDYRQMGRVLDEWLLLKIQGRASQGEEESDRTD